MESVTWTPKPKRIKDRHGRTQTSTAEPVELSRCLIAPTRAEDRTEITRDGEVLAWDVFVTRRTVHIQRGDTVIIRGERFTVETTPFNWVPARRARANHGTRFTAVRSEG